MSENKDQNRDLSDQIKEGLNEQDLAEVNQLLAEEDPEFVQQISADIQISASGIGLSVMDQALSEASRPQLTFLDKVKSAFSKNPKTKIFFLCVILATTGSVYFIWKGSFQFLNQSLFLNSFESFGDVVHDYNPLSEAEYFYDNPHFDKNLMTISKMFVNVQPSENSGPTPMLAIEITIEGISSDAIIELKDREAEFKDFLLRYAEERNYDELITTDGKQKLCDQFRFIINAHLTQGQARRVLLKSFIIKP